jgi:4-hydroxy-tetrahydrodipicolinate synthase
MSYESTLRGVLAPVITPFTRNLEPDRERLVRQCRWLLSQNCGLAAFGTNSEANSLSLAERRALLDALVEAGLPPGRMMPGTGCCAFPDTVELTKHAVSIGAGGVLMLPPFYYKNVSDEGLYRSFSEVIERVGDDRLRIYLYHFPQMSAVPLGVDLVGRLREAYPGIVVGMKDSSGDPENLERMLSAFPGFALFAGSEMLLLRNLRLGGAGCISATANVNPKAIDTLCQKWESDEADALQAGLDAVRKKVQQFTLVPALKAIVSHYAGDAEWNRLRPPLVELRDEDAKRLVEDLEAIGFEMPGLATA